MNAHDIDALIDRIKAEAASRTQQQSDADPGTFGYDSESDYLQLPAVTLPALAGTGARGPASLDQLHGISDEAFVEQAYRLLLRREADSSGMRDYLTAMEKGTSRTEIAAVLRLSQEGRACDVPVLRMRRAVMLVLAKHALQRVGLGALAEFLLRQSDRRGQQRAERTHGPLRAVQSLRHGLQKAFTDWQRPLQTISSLVLRHDRTLNQLRRQVHTLEQQLAVTREDAQYLRQVALRAGPNQADAPQAAEALVSSDVIDAYYVAFENAARGSLEEIRAKLSVYDDWIEAFGEGGGTLLDIGCGRGEWLTMLAERGIAACGIDTNRVMVDLCRAQGLEAQAADALGWLRAQPDASLGAVSAFHVIEHLPFDYLFAMVAEIRRVLAPGGRVLFETPNPENVLVGSHTFFHDFSHRNPVTPTAISFLLSYHGFGDIDLIRSSPYPAEARVPGDDPLTERVNGHLCGPQDFAVVAQKPRLDTPHACPQAVEQGERA